MMLFTDNDTSGKLVFIEDDATPSCLHAENIPFRICFAVVMPDVFGGQCVIQNIE